MMYSDEGSESGEDVLGMSWIHSHVQPCRAPLPPQGTPPSSPSSMAGKGGGRMRLPPWQHEIMCPSFGKLSSMENDGDSDKAR